MCREEEKQCAGRKTAEFLPGRGKRQGAGRKWALIQDYANKNRPPGAKSVKKLLETGNFFTKTALEGRLCLNVYYSLSPFHQMANPTEISSATASWTRSAVEMSSVCMRPAESTRALRP